jgi:hypothetical protein
MTKAALIKEIAKREGKKSQVTIGNIREIIRIIEDIEVETMKKGIKGPLDVLDRGAARKYEKGLK